MDPVGANEQSIAIPELRPVRHLKFERLASNEVHNGMPRLRYLRFSG